MFSTSLLIIVAAIVAVVEVVLWLIMLKLGARWAKISGVTTRRALLATLIVIFGCAGVGLVSIAYEPKSLLPAILVLLLSLAVHIGWNVIVIGRILHASSWQAFRAWLPTLLVSAFGVALAFLVIRPFLCEGFLMPTNSMAPTILGVHLTDVCPTCGKPAFGSAPRDHESTDVAIPTVMICEEFHVHSATVESKVSDGDRFLAMKIFRPRRWDLIAFRFPGDPKMNYVKRLVGLPGEEVFIKDGSLWINGQRREPPESLRGLKYVTEFPGFHPDVCGTPDNPAKLGDGEYFVLGDFSKQSADSRLWKTGAPGHPGYAVPESYVIGVVTHIYWPPSRWRLLR